MDAGLSNILDCQTLPILSNFLQVIFWCCLEENVHLSVTFISLGKGLPFLIIVGPITGFPSERIAVSHLTQHIYSCCNFVCVSVSCLKGHFIAFT